MSSIRQYLSGIFGEAFEKAGLDKSFGAVVESQRPDLSQFQCNGAMAAAKVAKCNPRQTAEKVAETARELAPQLSIELAGPGFMNISVSDEFIAANANSSLSSTTLRLEMPTPQKIVIDFGGPNVAKPMHVGHLRSSIIGDSLQRLLRRLGHSVVTDNHIGDWGTQMGMLICKMREEQPSLPYFDEKYSGEYPKDAPCSIADLERMYPQASAHCKTDEVAMAEAVKATDELQKGRAGYIALWKHFVALSVETLKKDFDALGVRFDHWYGESHYTSAMRELTESLRRNGCAVESEGALVMHVAREDDKAPMPPVLLVKSGGGFLYATSDIATIDFRMKEFAPDRIIYVVDKRQSQHFEQVFRAVRIASIVKSETGLEHTGFGTVNGPDGKPFKTRAGGVMRLSDLITMVTDKARSRMTEAEIGSNLSDAEKEDIAVKVGMATLKFADLSNHRLSDYVFDLEKFSCFEGKTGPYLLYTAVRIKSIMRKAADAGFAEGPITGIGEPERKLLLILASLTDAINAAAENLAPNFLCDYAYSLAQEFNRFYNDCHIMREENVERRSSWLSIAKLSLLTMESALDILGISMPDRM